MGNGTDELSLHKITIRDGMRHSNNESAGQSGCDLILYAEHNENLYHLLAQSGIGFAAPCGGNARCGKCLVRVLTDQADMQPALSEERELIPDGLYRDGYRLACFLHVDRNLVISLYPHSSAPAQIITSGLADNIAGEPFVRKYAINIAGQTLDAQIPDAEHIAAVLAEQLRLPESEDIIHKPDPDAIGDAARGVQTVPAIGDGVPKISGMRAAITPEIFSDIEILRTLSNVASDGGGLVTCIRAGDRIIGAEPGDTSAVCYGAAFDIGTTTIAGYLYDLIDGRSVAVASSLNPQAGFGADVITRINYATSKTGGAAEMKICILDEINRMLRQLTLHSGIGSDGIYAVYITGNTTMLHFFMGLPAGKIAIAPFIPVTTSICLLTKEQSGLIVNNSATIVCLPGVSAYVGADTLTAALACGIDQSDGINLLIDIGTNGEIVIGGKEFLYACSTAAGPAFEGASISNGVGGIEGAVDSVKIDPDGKISYTTIGNADAIGICGSGLVDLVAQLLRIGIIDETGRLVEPDEAADCGVPEALCDRLVTIGERARAFKLISSDDAMSTKDIYITQRDARELQNAKAAIAAGIRTLLAKAGLAAKDIGRVFLAGGFGSYINVSSALDIGLIMREFEGRVTPAGNAAGAGAVKALLSGKAADRLTDMSQKMRYVELSASAEFTQAYIDCMTFE